MKIRTYQNILAFIDTIRQACYLARKGDHAAAKKLFQDKEKTCSQHST